MNQNQRFVVGVWIFAPMVRSFFDPRNLAAACSAGFSTRSEAAKVLKSFLGAEGLESEKDVLCLENLR